MRLGGPLFTDTSSPELWIAALRACGYTAAYCPLGGEADDDVVHAYETAALNAGVIIAEVGAWSNPLASDDHTRSTAIAYCQSQLNLADRIGAKCCVNIAGSRGEQWDGPNALNLTSDTFDAIVETTRGIIDAVKPTRTFYTLETMPWAYPDSPESYVRLIEAIDRPQFAVHLDPANLINCPDRYFHNEAFVRDCFRILGPWIKSCHAKDVAMSPTMLVHIDEVRPGLGTLDYAAFLQEAQKLDRDLPVMLEHLPNEEEYRLAAEYVRSTAQAEGILA